MNKISIDTSLLDNKTIKYNYEVSGEWTEAFAPISEMCISYSCDLCGIPDGIAVIPFLANLLPMAWVYDAEIVVPYCDEAFYHSIEEFKQGYRGMYPMMHFGGKLTVGEMQKNVVDGQCGSAAFFSGGVDAFNTLTQHADEKPTLLTLWGADVKLNDEAGWQNVEHHLKRTAADFDVDYVTITSEFRMFLNDRVLSRKVAESGDRWWHGFQHGIGIISHAAPAVYMLGLKTVYFASSFTAADKGKVTCASDPTIDNYVKFCGCNVVHDGYEFTRQMKIHNITQYSQRTGKHIPLRVCWESTGGSNCCNCEKCWRTMLGIYAEGFDPHNFGFEYDDAQLGGIAKRMKHSGNPMFSRLRYEAIQKAMKQHNQKENLPKEIRWFYDADINTLGNIQLWKKVWRLFLRCGRKVKRILVK